MVFNHLEETHHYITYAGLRIDKKICASVIHVHVGAIILFTKQCNYFLVIMSQKAFWDNLISTFNGDIR